MLQRPYVCIQTATWTICVLKLAKQARCSSPPSLSSFSPSLPPSYDARVDSLSLEVEELT